MVPWWHLLFAVTMNFSPVVREGIKNLLLYQIDTDTEGNVRLDKNYQELPDKGWPKRGAYGRVYKMLRMEDLKVVAVKEITLNLQTDYNAPGVTINRHSRSVISDSKATYDFLMACQEAVLQSSDDFRHVNIVKCYESWIRPPSDDPDWNVHIDPEKLIEFIDDNSQITNEMKRCLTAAKGMQFYIVMDFYEENLEDRYSAATKVPSRDETKSILCQISKALQFVHDQGYVHRDLKPKNILISTYDRDPDQPQVALGDFGLCRRILDGNEGRAGTPPYDTAPEQQLTVKFDMWSLGIMMFELFLISESEIPPNEDQKLRKLNRLVKFAKTNNQDQLKQFAGSTAPRAIKKLIVRCLQVLPNDRLSSEEAMDSLCGQ